MKTTGEILRKKREDKNLKVQEIADRLGVTQPYVTLIENNKKNPSKKYLEEVKKLLNLSDEEIKKIEEFEKFRRIPEEFQNKILDLENKKNLFNQNVTDSIITELTEIPLYGTICAGLGRTIEAAPIDYIFIPKIKGEAVAVIVSGDSMEPVISAGDYVVVKKDIEVLEGEIGVFILNQETGEGVVKRLKLKDDMYVLSSDNSEYEDIDYTSNVLCCGKVIHIIKNKTDKIEEDPLVKLIESLPSKKRKMAQKLLESILEDEE